MTHNLVGIWNLDVKSPLGIDKYQLFISETMTAAIGEQRGKMQFTDFLVKDDSFFMSGFTETPLRANVSLHGTFDDNNIFGKIAIDNYCLVDFEGTKNG
jgi:hypothetical protein